MTDGRAILLRHTSERNFQDWVKREAVRAGGWRGFHVRLSLASVEGLTRDQAYGFPDWLFVGHGRAFWRELKSPEGELDRFQRAWRDALREAGQDWGVWRPQDEDLVRATFRGVA